MQVLAIGASRNIGYYTSIRLLEKGATVTFLLRSLAAFDNDAIIKNHVSKGTAQLVQGDALNPDDVGRAWQTAAGENGAVDLVLFTVGGTPRFDSIQGFVITPANLCTQALFVLVPYLRAASSQPRLVVISSNGLSRASHAKLPLLIKPVYGYLIRGPHADKLGMERLVAHCAGWSWTDEDPKAEIMPDGWQEKAGESGWLKSVVVVRPALLSDGPCKADASANAYRLAEGDLNGAYRVSRKDVGHFLAEGLLSSWERWEGKCVSIAY